MILIFPALDLKDGKCVRLVQGEPGTEKIYSEDPVQMAILWRGENAKTLHVVDLDGAFEGSMKNLDVIKKMADAVEIPIQVGGGIRTFEQIQQLFSIGVYRVVLGTVAIEDPGLVRKAITEYGMRKVAIGIDAKNGVVMTQGWQHDSGTDAISLALKMKDLGACRIVYTDINRDGMMTGPNFDAIKEMAVRSGLRITASGGISGYKDLIRLQELERFGVDSVIVGKALYENRFPCEALWRLNEKGLQDFGPTRRI